MLPYIYIYIYMENPSCVSIPLCGMLNLASLQCLLLQVPE